MPGAVAAASCPGGSPGPARRDLGQLAEAVGRPVAWTTSALLVQQPMTAAQAKAAGSLLDLGEDVQQALLLQPTRGALETAVPADPTIYRLYEVLQVYGPTIKELIHEQDHMQSVHQGS